MSARQQILGRVKRALDQRASLAARTAGAAARLASPRANPLPERARSSGAARTARFVAEAERANAEVVRLGRAAAIPAAVRDLLAGLGGVSAFRAAPDPALMGLDWAAAGLKVEFGPGRPQDAFALSRAWAGVAETGTLVLLSGPTSPVTLNFLPDVHAVVLEAATLVGAYEETWARLRTTYGWGPASGPAPGPAPGPASGPGAALPRTVNWITGPSRTADIEQSILLGAHGPRRLVILLVDGEETPATA